MRKKLGLIVNPVAGVGGRVGLKGSDGPEILKKAFEMGALPEAPRRAEQALERLTPIRDRLEIVTWPGAMGEDEARSCGFVPTVLEGERKALTTPGDTEEAARRMLEEGVDLLLFAGGDGTARNIFDAVGDRVPALGIPAGVKIHSAVYANSPQSAGDLARQFLEGERAPRLREAEVMDIDEEAFRSNRVSAMLYGYLEVPYERRLLQGAKAGSRGGSEESILEIASKVIEEMTDDHLYLIGSGTTTRAIMQLLELPCTLLGVDAVFRRELVASDVNEARILELLKEQPGKIVVTVIGGQGHVFGRGNQQLSPRVIREVGRKNITIVATLDKIVGLGGRPLLVDTGDPEINEMLSGYFRVTIGLGREVVYQIAS